QARIDQRGVIEPVLEHGIAALQQRGTDAEVRHVAAGKQKRPLATEKFRKALLQLMVNAQVAADEMCRAAARAIKTRRLIHRLDHSRIGGEPEVIIGTEVEVLAA